MRTSILLVGATCLVPMVESALYAQTVTTPDTPHDRESDDPSDAQVHNLWKLGKVWGFLKYHHPAITRQEVDWDQVLLDQIPDVLAASDGAAGTAVLESWIETYPAPEAPRRTAREPKDAKLLPDLDWIRDAELLGDDLSSYLVTVHAHRSRFGHQRYVGRARGVGNPTFDTEDAYADLVELDEGYRLLALFRFWNIVQWWSPYRDLLDDDWDEVLERFIPRFLACETRTDYDLELVALAARVKDTHTHIWSAVGKVPPAGPLTLPVTFRFVEGKAVVWQVREQGSDEPPLRTGDVLLEIDGQSVDALVRDLAHLYPASNQPTRLRGIAGNLGRGQGRTAALRIERDHKELTLEVERVDRDLEWERTARLRDRPGPAFQLLGDDVAYVKLSTAKVDEIPQYLEQMQGTRGLVVDIRNYPNEFMVLYKLGGHLVKEPTPFATFTAPSMRNPGSSEWGGTSRLAPIEPHYPGRVVILVDETSQSRAEFTAMAFQSVPGSTVIGSTTAGADGNASWFSLPGGHRSMISGVGVYYPDRTPAQRVGVAIDEHCLPTVDGIRAGRDELLEAALRTIRRV